MKRNATLSLALGMGMMVSATSADGQSILSNLETLAADNAEFYVAPLVTGLGATLNSGFHQTASVHGMFGFDLGLRVMAARPPAEAEFFTPSLPGSVSYEGFSYDQPYQLVGSGVSPTAVGDGDGAVISPAGQFRQDLIAAGENPDDYQLQFPEGANIPAVPFVVLQGSVGVGLNTEVTLRYLPRYNVHDDVGEISAFGYGIKHSLSAWLPMSPAFDVAVTAGWQDLQIGEYLDATASNYGLIASVSTGPLTIYGLGRREQSTVDISYAVENDSDNPGLPDNGVEIAFSNKLAPQNRMAAGVTFHLVALEISAEYAFAEYNTLAAKVGLSVN